MVGEQSNVEIPPDIGFYLNCRTAKPSKALSIEDVAERVRTDSSLAQMAKTELPAVCFQTADPRTAGSTQHWGGQLVAYDIDHITTEQIDNIKTALRDSVALAYTTHSKKGMRIVFWCAGVEDYPDAWRAGKRYLRSQGVVVDEACKDLGRLSFLSYDPEAICNPRNSVEMAIDAFLVDLWGDVETEPQQAKISTIEREQGAVLEGAQVLEALDIFQKVARQHPNWAQEGNRNTFANLLANDCKKAGLAMVGCLKMLSPMIEEASGYPQADVLKTFRSVYGNSSIQAGVSLDFDLSSYELTSDTALPPIDYLLSVDGVGFLSRGNIAFISGRQKVGKTFLITLLVAEYLARSPTATVVWVDTEQSKQHVQKAISRLERMTWKGCARFFPLREYGKKPRTELFRTICEHTKPDLIVLDGVIDICENPMELASSQEAIQLLMTLSTRLNAGILSVLHTNKGDTNEMRAHIGTEAGNKGETTLYLEPEKYADAVKVSFKSCRGIAPMDFNFEIIDGQPQRCVIAPQVKAENYYLLFSGLCAQGQEYRHSELVRLLEQEGQTNGGAKMTVRRATQSMVLTKQDNGKYIFGGGL